MPLHCCVRLCCIYLTLGASLAVPVGADEIEQLREQLQAQARIIESLQSRLNAVEEKQAAQPPAAVAAPASAPAPANSPTPAPAAKDAGGVLPALRSSVPMELYGLIKVDASRDSDGTNNGNFQRWVDPGDSGRDDSQFTLTARQTRLGIRANGPDVMGLSTEGRVEIDFYGDGAENAPEVRMRYANFTANWPEHNTELLFGQAVDLVSPYSARTLNFTNLWWTGNMGYRRPQIRATRHFKLADKRSIEVALAATRNIGDANTRAFGEDTGSDAGYPALQGRVAYEFINYTDRKSVISLSGHYGQEEFDFRSDSGRHWSDQSVKTWSANFSAMLELSSKLQLTTEAFTGANLDAYASGIGQGVTLIPFEDGQFNIVQEVRARGAWADLEIGPFGKWRFTVGGGIEDLEESDLLPGARSRNIGVFANALYDLRKNIELGVELAHWRTSYVEEEDRSNLRLQGSATLKF